MLLPAGRGILDWEFKSVSKPIPQPLTQVYGAMYPIMQSHRESRHAAHRLFSDLVLAAGTVRFVLTAGRDMARDVLGIMPDTPNER